tara:strand:+ start:807 stop:1340 length:534 start_codon:yes stop_codon:yes gene_type:complete
MALATSSEFKAGLNWYKDARDLCTMLSIKYDNSVSQIAQVISVLSPQKKWETNKAEVVCLYAQVFDNIEPPFNYFATKKQLEECKQIMLGNFSIPPKRIKTYSFADNISNLNSQEITIDRHALRVAYDDKTSTLDKVTLKQYKAAREAYKLSASQHGLEGYEVQAITWTVYKRIVNR